MHLKPVERHQGDDKQDEYSLLTGLDCPPEEDKARQEFAEEADINNIVRRMLQGGMNQRQPIYSMADWDMDLQQAMHAVSDAKEMHARLPQNLREKYRTWTELLNAVESGELKIDLRTADEIDRELSKKEANNLPPDLET